MAPSLGVLSLLWGDPFPGCPYPHCGVTPPLGQGSLPAVGLHRVGLWLCSAERRRIDRARLSLAWGARLALPGIGINRV